VTSNELDHALHVTGPVVSCLRYWNWTQAFDGQFTEDIDTRIEVHVCTTASATTANGLHGGQAVTVTN